jgi:outer membrane protein, heavy metal efflux system
MPTLLRALLCIAFGLPAIGVPAPARTQPDPLTFRSAAEEALRANPELRAARQTIEGARGRLLQAGLGPNPELSLGASSDFAFAAEGEQDQGLAISQRFPIAGRLARARDVAKVDVELASAEVRDAERTLVAEVEATVLRILTLDRTLEARDQVIGAVRQLVETSELRFRAAQVSEADVSLLAIDLAALEQDRRLLALDHATEVTHLNRLLHRPPATPLSVTGDVAKPILALRTPAELWATASERRPDLARMRLEAERARAEAALARAEAWEDWTVGANYARTRGTFDVAGSQIVDRSQLLGVAVQVPLPLWNRNQGRIAEAISLERQAGSRLEALERRVQEQIEATSRRAEELKRVGREYQEALVPRAARTVELLGRGYRQGLSPISDLVQAEQQLADATLAHVRTLGELRQAEIELEAAASLSPLLSTPEEAP